MDNLSGAAGGGGRRFGLRGAAIGAALRAGRHCGERGSQSLEWVTLGGLVATVMTAATTYVAHDQQVAADVANFLLGSITSSGTGSR